MLIMSSEDILQQQSSAPRGHGVMNGSWIPSHLRLTVLQARDLALKSKNVNSEVYVTVQLDKEKASTALLTRHTDPIWNQTFEIPLMSFQSILEVQVRQKSKFVDEHIGQIRVSINNLKVSKTLRKSWYKLAAKPGKTSAKIRGDILLATSFLSNWDTKESAAGSHPIIDFDLPESSGKMLHRSKSEYKSKSKSSPKTDKHKSKSVFDRIRKNKSAAVFEECEDFLVSVRTPESPPTPPAGSERVNKTSSLTRSGSNGDHSSSIASTSTDFQEMFNEATQLEKKGVLNLSLVDPKTRVELGKQRFESTLMEDSEGRQENEDVGVSPIVRSYSFRHKRPLRTQSLSMKNISSQDSDHTQNSTPTSSITASTPTSSSSPKSITTYRATSMRRKKKMTSGGSQDGMSVEGSITSVEGVDSVTSEYYSNTSKSSLTLDSSNDVKMNGSLLPQEKESKAPSKSVQPLNTDQAKEINEEKIDSDNSKDGQFLRVQDVEREKSVPMETQTLQRDEVQLRKNRRRFASETFDRNRHSADIESLLRLTANPQGKNDGLGNVLDTQKINRRLKQQLTVDRTPPDPIMASSLSQPSTYLGSPVTRSASHTPLHTSPIVSTLGDSSPGLISPTESDRSDMEPPSTSQEDNGPLHKTESLPAIKRTYWDNRPEPLVVYPKHATPLGDGMDKAASFFESEGSSSTASALYPSSNISSSLDSSFSSDYASLSNNRRLDDDNPSDSQCTTPTDTTPTITREGTPSPQEQSPLIENVKISNDNARLSTKRLQHTFNKSSLATSKENISPLPPSLKYSTLPTRGKFANSVKAPKNNMADLVSEAVKVLAPYESKDLMNLRAVKVPPTKYSLSASNSGRTSPVIEEENEEDNHQDTTSVVVTPPQNVEAGDNKKTPDSDQQPSKPPNPVKPNTDQPKSQLTRDHKRLGQATSYESGSPQRRRPSGNSVGGGGGGLKKAISLYQDSKRSTTGAGGPRRALFRDQSLDTGKEKPVPPRPSTHRPSPRKLPSTAGGKRRSREEIQTTNKLSSSSKQSVKNTPSKSIDPETNTTVSPSSSTVTATSNQFDLPPPPDVSHTVMAEQLCGMNQEEDTSSRASLSHDHTTPSVEGGGALSQDHALLSTDKDWKSSSQSTVATSSDEYEDLLEDELHRLSKQELIHLVIDINEKFKKSKQRLVDTRSYLDSLLLKVMEHHPELLAL